MAEMQDVTEALSRVLPTRGHPQSDVESIRHATISIQDIPALIEDPKGIVRALGVPIQDHSQWNVSLVKRSELATARYRPVVVIIVHFDDCSGVIVVFY
jgi:hypothetical protein